MLSDYAHRVRAHARPLSWPWPELAAIVVQAALFLPLIAFRFVDGDEGAYLAAATLVMDGALPYGDFLYTQMPLLPYVYGLWTEVWGEEWFAARLLSVVFAIALGVLLFRHLLDRFGRPLAMLGLVLHASTSLVLVWYPTVKTYALTALLVFGAYVLVERSGRVALARWILAGLLVGLAVDTRLLLVGAVPAFAWAAYRSSENLRAVTGLAGGFLAGLTPSLVLFANDPDRFLFGNLWYHGSRSPGGLVGDFQQKAEVVANLLGIATDTRPHPQFLLLALAGLAAAVVLRLLRGSIPLSLVIAGFLVIVSLAPTPTYAQYVCIAVPFLVVGVIEVAAALRTPLSRERGLAVRAVLALGVAAYVVLGAADVYRFTTSSNDRIAAVADVAAVVAANTRPGEEVVAGWPGYLFGSDAVPVPGLENDFAPHEAAFLPPEDVRRYRMASVEDVERMIGAHRTRLVVAGVWENNLPPIADFEGTARRSGYELLAEVSGVKIFALPAGSP